MDAFLEWTAHHLAVIHFSVHDLPCLVLEGCAVASIKDAAVGVCFQEVGMNHLMQQDVQQVHGHLERIVRELLVPWVSNAREVPF